MLQAGDWIEISRTKVGHDFLSDYWKIAKLPRFYGEIVEGIEKGADNFGSNIGAGRIKPAFFLREKGDIKQIKAYPHCGVSEIRDSREIVWVLVQLSPPLERLRVG
jgi:hypothetical protein